MKNIHMVGSWKEISNILCPEKQLTYAAGFNREEGKFVYGTYASCDVFDGYDKHAIEATIIGKAIFDRIAVELLGCNPYRFSTYGNCVHIYDKDEKVILCPTEDDFREFILKTGKAQIERINKENMEKLHILKLTSGYYLWNNHVTKYGYQSGLCFLARNPYEFDMWPLKLPLKDLSLKNGKSEVKGVRGEYFISKKGTKCFRINPDGKHWLLKYSWGGSFNTDRGGQLFELPNIIYKLRNSSHGGGSGIDYVVIPITE